MITKSPKSLTQRSWITGNEHSLVATRMSGKHHYGGTSHLERGGQSKHDGPVGLPVDGPRSHRNDQRFVAVTPADRRPRRARSHPDAQPQPVRR
jgi:hypothetical protein